MDESKAIGGSYRKIARSASPDFFHRFQRSRCTQNQGYAQRRTSNGDESSFAVNFTVSLRMAQEIWARKQETPYYSSLASFKGWCPNLGS